ncbi:hypothetical protein [Amycolatopsis sp. NPDC004079]|uniref:hypothetical protein n=1 Tax=Amycolatopsis sp. NPDC004079 TaxID=3154549 RepID=UPI0033B0AE44
MTFLTASLVAGTVQVPAAAVDRPRGASAASTGSTDTDRAKVGRLWQFGGPATKRDAAVALVGSDADVTRFLTAQKDVDASIDRSIHVNQLMSSGGVATRTAAQKALDANSDDALEAFLDTGWQGAHENDLALRVNQMMAAGGPQLKQAAQKALDANSEEALRSFLATGWKVPFGTDQAVRVNQEMAAGGPEVKKAAQQALDANSDDALTQFLAIDLPVAQARDAETATIADLVATANAASAQAATQTQLAKQESDRAVTEAAAAAKAAQAAKDAAAAAQGHAGQATEAAEQAAYAANQAAITAREAIGAANAASRAAHTAAAAASRAAAAASRAGQAASNAYDAAAQATLDKEHADVARQSAQTARDAALGAEKAAGAARAARTASQQAENAGAAAHDAALQSSNAAAAATDAANNAAAAGADARQAQAAAATARAQAARAVSAANASQSWAHEASDAAEQSATAADAAAVDATAAAQAADDAAAHAGQAADAAKKATEHANAATAAANTAVAAANRAIQIAQAARKADDDRIAQASQTADDAAKSALATYAAHPKPKRWDVDQVSTWDAETTRLIAEATAAGAPRATVLTDARKVALTLADTGGQWTKAAAQAALAATDDEAVDFVTTGVQAAAGQDDRSILRQLCETATTGFQNAANTALAGSDTGVRDFLRSRDYAGREQDDALQVNQVMSGARAAGRAIVVQYAQKALDANTDQALRDFLDTGQYTALGIDDQVKVNQVMSGARTAGQREVVAGAQAALDGPPTLLHEFLMVGQYSAARRDQNTAAHNAAIDSLLAQASRAAANATHDANEAQAAAARARNAADEANGYAQQAAAAASQADGYAKTAQAAADRAAASAKQAQDSANAAARAAASAVASADAAGRSAAWAQHSAQVAANYAREAMESAATAHQMAVDAGKDAHDAAVAAQQAWEAVATKAKAEKQQAIQDRQASCRDQYRSHDSLLYLNNQDCNLLFSGSKADQERVLAHLQEVCRNMNPAGSADTARCLDPHNLLSANFAARPFDGSGQELSEYGGFVLMGLVALACPECDLVELLGGAVADLADGVGLGEIFAGDLLDVTMGSALDAASVRATAEGGEAADLAAEAAAEESQLAKTAEELSEEPIPCVGNSFPGETPVLLADGTTKRIGLVKPGDVIANSRPYTAHLQKHVVTGVHVSEDDKSFVRLSVSTDTGNGIVNVTSGHLLWNDTSKKWMPAASFKAGDYLHVPSGGRAKVSGIHGYVGHLRTYNLTVSVTPTFYVLAGRTPILVHNGAMCVKDLGNGVKLYDDGSVRIDGKWAGSTGSVVGAAKEAQAWDQLASEGMTVVRGRIYTRGNGMQVRVYDGAVDLGNGKYLGIEVKPTVDYRVEPWQKAFDAWVGAGNVAKGYGGAAGYDIVGVLPVVVLP